MYSQSPEEQFDKVQSLLVKGQSFLYTQRDSADYFLSKSFDLAEKEDFLNDKLTILLFLIRCNTYHYDLTSLKENIDVFENILTEDKRTDTLYYSTFFKRRLLLEKGNYFYDIKNYPESEKNIKAIINDIESDLGDNEVTPDDLYELNSAYSFLASIYEDLDRLDLSMKYHNKTLSIIEKYSDVDWNRQKLNTNTRLARVYEKQGNFKKGNDLLKESLALYLLDKDNPRSKNSLLSTYQRLSNNYLFQDSIAKAIIMLKESESYYVENDAFQRSAEKLYAEIYSSDKQYEKAETFYKSYLDKTLTYRQNQKHQDVAEAYTGLGSLYMLKEDPSTALEYYQESLMQLAPDFTNKDIKVNPDPKKVLSKLALVKVLKEKLKALQLLFKKNNNTKDLEIAFTTSNDIIKTLDLLKPEFESKIDKQFLITEMYPAFHSMVEIAFDLYTATNESKYIDAAFYFSEKSKSVILLEATRSTQASSFGGVPEEIIDKEQQFRANIIHLEKKFFNQRSDIAVFDSLFQLKNRYYNFISDMEQKYPKYYDLKYNADVVSLEEISESLLQNKALISYVATSTDLYVITLEDHRKYFYKVPLEKKDREMITNFYSLLSNLNVKELPDIYAEGYEVYKRILMKPLEKIESKELLIIPDDILNYLPFEALTTSNNAADYLIKEYQISYTNSATLLREQQNTSKSERNNLVAYAPSFEKAGNNISQDRPNFGPLLYNTDEVTQITSFFNGKAIIGNEASLASFSENSETYSMLHFATHAATNDEYPDYSYLAFANDDSGENGLLYVKDLYGYNINADLVALSACQTGLGKLEKGEGMLSLARGFSYAGAKSLVNTLWKINDQTTADLMYDFYKNLNKSLPKDQALREAKLTYLKNAEDDLLMHPYYWSGFMISGDTTPLESSSSFLWWLLLLFIPVIIVIIKKVKSSNT
ncbi:CHAT domain-containing tetratricopeptide repeat protein [uncultured Aquimarina sp.]|uniref:CHAT domain-containing protein n=1 Tax=uncultured Aquimarina sp. TaxID=575652 RepID=UPI002601AE90|nr:CHAT domain-containing tetratricopeptide repeat protein [uncultured Aquimarina sp.]